MRKGTFISVLLLLALLLSAGRGVVVAKEMPPAETLSSSDQELGNDQELAELVAEYEKLLRDKALSADELAELIVKDDNEKARFIGIRATNQFSTDENTKGSELLGVCIRPIWGPGKVKWNFSNPGQNGAKYSVKPEGSNPLIWASPPEQDIDGIYRSYWGSCMAYKIPDSATATFYSAESWDVCYNAFACEVLGKCPKWINPCDNGSPEGSWPDNPLW
jgi:hypothetical protein